MFSTFFAIFWRCKIMSLCILDIFISCVWYYLILFVCQYKSLIFDNVFIFFYNAHQMCHVFSVIVLFIQIFTFTHSSLASLHSSFPIIFFSLHLLASFTFIFVRSSIRSSRSSVTYSVFSIYCSAYCVFLNIN